MAGGGALDTFRVGQYGVVAAAFDPSSVSPNPAITVLTVLFGLVWTAANLYLYYPLGRALLLELRTRFAEPDRGTHEPLPDGGTPRIDLFIPAYNEADVVAQSIESVCALEYPDDAFQLTVLLEPDDDRTRAVVNELTDRLAFDVLTVPADYPEDPNKPRALNYGFEHTSGDIVGVIDAEDIVEGSTLRQVAGAIGRGADYVQGRLDMANEDDGWLNLLFRAEYGYWYNLITPAFARIGYPIPMAGTTCFFRRDVLETASATRLDQRGDPWSEADWQWVTDRGLTGWRPWDPQNVTEDFELGLFLWELGYDFGYLDAVTTEESPPTLDGWVGQRTRWKKGKVYTFLDRRRYPPSTLLDRLHVYWQSALPHLGPLNVAGVVVILLISNLARYEPGSSLGVLLTLGGVFAGTSAAMFAAGYWSVSGTPLPVRIRRSLLTMVSLPLYWLLQWGADIRAIVRLYGGDLGWEHTEHFGRQAVTTTDDTVGNLGRRSGRLTLPRVTRWGALALVVGVAVALRVFVLGGWSLWTDELYSVAIRGDLPVTQLLVHPTDPHPPLYYLLLHGWMELFGEGRTAVRSLSVLGGVLTVVAVYLLGTELFEDRTGLLAAVMVAVSPFFIHHSRVARMYAVFTFLTAFSWYWYTRLRDGTTTSAVGYVLTTALLAYTHVYGLFVVLAQHVYTTLSETDGGIARQRWIRVSAALGALVLPWIGLLVVRVVGILFGTGGANIEWIPEPSASLPTRTALSFVGFPDYYPITAGNVWLYLLASALLFVFVFQATVSTVRISPDGLELSEPASLGQAAALLFVPTLVPLAISFVVPIYVPRYAAPAGVGFVVLAARGLRNVPTDWIRFGLLAVVLLSSLTFTGVYYTTDSTEPWSTVAQSVGTDAGPDDVVVHQPGQFGVAERYYGDHSFETATVQQPPRVDRQTLLYAGNLSARHDTFFLIQYRGGDGPVVRYLDACHGETVEQNLGAITVYRYPGDPACPDPGPVLASNRTVAG
ncbi:glycosyltransferase [Haloarcula sp. GH36]|uniref:glycosyltransferase n=1 Tax=Haloarcula montana TaxID=3111776 RepID=UPI002D79D77C|nr:glycosyltransferase [Haloarcula sp. GH36]